MALPSSSSPPGDSPSADRGTGRSRPARVITLVATGVLLLDAGLLAVAGWWGDRPVLLIWAGVFAAAAAGTVALRRRYLARLEELRRAREALRTEIRDLARTIREPHR